MLRRTNRFALSSFLVVGLLAAGGISSVALAQHPADADLGDAPIEFVYLEDQDQLVYWLSTEVPDGEEPLDCAVLLDADAEGELPEECVVVDVAGPNGQVNHGSIVSSVVHSIKDLDYDGPRGHLVREIARTRFVDDAEAVDGDDASGEPEDRAEKVKKPKKDKKPKREGHPGRGNNK